MGSEGDGGRSGVEVGGGSVPRKTPQDPAVFHNLTLCTTITS